jgi:hypothetical protein
MVAQPQVGKVGQYNYHYFLSGQHCGASNTVLHGSVATEWVPQLNGQELQPKRRALQLNQLIVQVPQWSQQCEQLQ